MESEIERKLLGDVQPQRESREEHGDEKQRDSQVAALLENAGESRDEQEMSEGFHGQRLLPGGHPAQAEKREVYFAKIARR
jgi:hypothetical protein